MFFWIMLQESSEWVLYLCLDTLDLHKPRIPITTLTLTPNSIFLEGTKVETDQTRAGSHRKGHHCDPLTNPWALFVCVCVCVCVYVCACLNKNMEENDFCAFWTSLYGNESLCNSVLLLYLNFSSVVPSQSKTESPQPWLIPPQWGSLR
jgi:hypothetical protein